jgi:hypothetical protein
VAFTWGGKLALVRSFLGFGQKEMGLHLGVKCSTYQNWEYDRALPSAEALARLVWMGFSADWLLIGEGPMRRAYIGEPWSPAVDPPKGRS